MDYVSGLFCAANYSCVRCACVDDLDETDDFDRLRAYAVSRLGAPPDSDDEGEACKALKCTYTHGSLGAGAVPYTFNAGTASADEDDN